MKALNAFAVAFLILWGVMCLIATLFNLDVSSIALDKILASPEWGAILGYDDLGRSILPRLIMGARTSLFVAISVVSISFVIGTCIGVIGAWYGNWLDKLIVILIDLFMAFPGVLLAIAFAGLLGPGIMNAVLALVLVGWVGFARLARAQTLSIKQRQHIEAALVLGSDTVTIARWHILPLILAPLIVEATFAVSGMVIAEAGLSFLGLGVQPPAASWGSMIREGTRTMLIAPHVVLAPGMTIFLVVLAINLLGDRLRDLMDKKGYTPAEESLISREKQVR